MTPTRRGRPRQSGELRFDVRILVALFRRPEPTDGEAIPCERIVGQTRTGRLLFCRTSTRHPGRLCTSCRSRAVGRLERRIAERRA